MITGKLYKKKPSGDYQILDASFIKNDAEVGFCHVLVFECPDAPDDSGNLDSVGSTRVLQGETYHVGSSWVVRVRKLNSVQSDKSIFYIQD